MYLASLVPCYHWRWLATCAVVGGGALFGKGVHITDPTSSQSAFFVAGARLGVEVPLYRFLALSISADALAHLTSVDFHLTDRTPLWTTPSLSGAFALGLVANFL